MNTAVSPSSMPKTPLNTRLTRLKEGFSSSPQFSVYSMRAFCDQKVMACLKDSRVRFLRLRLTEIANDYLGQADPSAVTYGDLAVWIMQNYRSAVPSKPADLPKVLSVYFYMLDSIAVQYSGVKPRSAVMLLLNEQQKRQYCFLEIPYADYRDEIRTLRLPANSRSFLKQMEDAHCFFDDTSLFDIYLTMHALLRKKIGRDIDDFPDPEDQENAPCGVWASAQPLKDYIGMIELFVVPIACLTWQLRKSRSKSAGSLPRQIHRKDRSNESEYHE